MKSKEKINNKKPFTPSKPGSQVAERIYTVRTPSDIQRRRSEKLLREEGK